MSDSLSWEEIGWGVGSLPQLQSTLRPMEICQRNLCDYMALDIEHTVYVVNKEEHSGCSILS